MIGILVIGLSASLPAYTHIPRGAAHALKAFGACKRKEVLKKRSSSTSKGEMKERLSLAGIEIMCGSGGKGLVVERDRNPSRSSV